MRHNRKAKRRGAVVPLVALSLVPLFGLVALAIDIGMVAVSRSQCQNAADTSAMAGARTFSGNSSGNYNLAAVPGKAFTAAVANRVLNQAVQGSPGSYTTVNAYTFKTGEVTIETGSYAYVYNDSDPSKEGFKISFPRTDTNEPYSAVRSTVTHQGGFAFGRVFGLSTFNTAATAVSVHRPRDVIIVMDLSGSMRFQSLPGIPTSGGSAAPSSTNRPRVVSMNPESVFPQFGHYSNVSSAALQGSTSYSTGAEMVDPANISATSNSGPPIIEDFYQNAYGVAPGPGNRAFSRAPDTQDKAPGGYNYLKSGGNTGANYAATVLDITGATTANAAWESKGYDQYLTAKTPFYTEGPGYWGKTFFIWPPDPRGSTLDANNAANHADNGAKDWRQRFFFKVNTANSNLGWLDHNTILFNTTGQPATNSNTTPTPVLKRPGNNTNVTERGATVTYTYRVNYAAIFHWLRQSPKHFPDQLRAGRIKYYDAIPDPSDTTLNNRFWTTATLSNLNERFWKNYVDFVLGLEGTGAGTYTNTQNSVPLSAMIGNGDFYQWGAVQISQKPDYYMTALVNKSGGYASGHNGAMVIDTANPSGKVPAAGDRVYIGSSNTIYTVASATATSLTLDKALTAAVADNTTIYFFNQYMSYTDNPYRPRHQYWFGPMTFVDWLGNYNTNQFWWPGNVHEAQCWACKVGIQTAIDDIKNNHPSDFIGMAYFSSPLTSRTDTSGQHNRAVVPLGRNYQQLKDSLWFPPSTIIGSAVEITPYDADFKNVPRANGGTAPGMGFMISYNLLSSSTSSLRSYAQPEPQYRGNSGGLGRKGAQRVIIFETDGAPNTQALASLGGSGSDSYYKIRIKYPDDYTNSGNTEWPSSNTYADSEVYDVVKQIVKLDSASPPGFSTSRKPAQVYSIGYGSLFDPNNPSTAQTDALDFLQNVSYYGNTATSTSSSSFPDSRRIYGTNAQRIARIQQAFTDIMQAGVQVSLIE